MKNLILAASMLLFILDGNLKSQELETPEMLSTEVAHSILPI